MEDKYLIAVCFILIGYLFYRQGTQENMSNSDITPQIKEVIQKLYNADVESIRNLSEVATKLQKEGLTIPGNLTVKE